MKKTYFVIALIAIIVLTWSAISMMNVHEARNRTGILLSPNKSKSVELFNKHGTSQIFLNFHKNFVVGGSNIATGDFNQDQIQIEWVDENTLNIETPKNTTFISKEDSIYFLMESVTIRYQKLK